MRMPTHSTAQTAVHACTLVVVQSAERMVARCRNILRRISETIRAMSSPFTAEQITWFQGSFGRQPFPQRTSSALPGPSNPAGSSTSTTTMPFALPPTSTRTPDPPGTCIQGNLGVLFNSHLARDCLCPANRMHGSGFVTGCVVRSSHNLIRAPPAASAEGAPAICPQARDMRSSGP